ncbi:MAG: hypothetical protein U1E28_05025 [Beijerinckiaceae bacterium]
MRPMFLVLSATSALAFAASPAFAQTYRQVRPYPATQPAYQYGSAPSGYACRQMCPMDVTPCDPPHYKIADGRCAATSPSLPF